MLYRRDYFEEKSFSITIGMLVRKNQSRKRIFYFSNIPNSGANSFDVRRTFLIQVDNIGAENEIERKQ